MTSSALTVAVRIGSRQIFNWLSLRTLRQGSAILCCLLLWQWGTAVDLDLGFLNLAYLPSPFDVLEAAKALLASPKLGAHVSNSLTRIFFGFAAAAVLGVALGLLMGRLRWAEEFLLPPLELVRPIPAVAWIPLAILMFPSSEVSMVFITFIGALFPILLNTIHGVAAIDQRLVASARSLGCRGWTLFVEVILPGAAPSIVTGLAIGMGTCWFCLVSAEMISGQFGLGYYTWESYTIQEYSGIVVGMLAIGLFGMLSSLLVRWLGERCMPWRRVQGGGK